MKKTLLVLSLLVMAFFVNATDGRDIYNTSNGYYSPTFSFITEENVTISINFYNDGYSTIAAVWAEGGNEGEARMLYTLEGIVKDSNHTNGTDALFTFLTNVDPNNSDLVSGTYLESDWWDFTSNYGDQTFEVKIYSLSNTLIFRCYVDFINDFLGNPGVTQASWYYSN